MSRQYNGTTDDLLGNPLWRQVATGIFEFVPNPEYTLGLDEERGGYCLTDGAGNLYVQGTVGQLAAYAFAFLYPGVVVQGSGSTPSPCGFCLGSAVGGVRITHADRPGVQLFLCPSHSQGR